MYIKSLVINGFKSFGKMVELNDFDPKLNTITGLNLTAKLNILDAIYFLLGISAKKTTIRRASITQNILHKSGQAGVDTATVTVTFDNTDKITSAPFYESYNEITISHEVGLDSKNIYKINGIIVTPKKVMDFFDSLQMNVNNPHFIITPDRMTEVLNMTPMEILSMIEESTTTNMDKSKKLNVGRKSSRTMQDADKQINQSMNIVIDKEKQTTNSLDLIQNQLKEQRNMLENWNYVQLIKRIKDNTEEYQHVQQLNQSKHNSYSSLQQTIEIYKKKIDLMNNTLTNETNKLAELRISLDQMTARHRGIHLEVKASKFDVQIIVDEIKDVEKEINNLKMDHHEKCEEKKKFNDDNLLFLNEYKKDRLNVDIIDQRMRFLNFGNIFHDDNSVQNNLLESTLELQKCQTKIEVDTIKINGLKDKLKPLTNGIVEAQDLYNQYMANIRAKEEEYKKIKNVHLKSIEDFNNHYEWKIRMMKLNKDINELKLKIGAFKFNNPDIIFHYKDPYPNFDRSKVHGFLCHFFKPVASKFELVLTNIAGNKLFNVIVEDENIIKDILRINKYSNLFNFIPLNEVKSECLSQDVISLAQQIGGDDKVYSALSLIEYDNKYKRVIEQVFGQAFICDSKEIAEKVCFDERINKCCFTLDGFHFNPSGSLTYEVKVERSILNKMAILHTLTKQLQFKSTLHSKALNIITQSLNLPDKVVEIRARRSEARKLLDVLRSDLFLKPYYQQVIEYNTIKKQIDDLEEILEDNNLKEIKLQHKIKDLELKMSNVDNILTKQLSEAGRVRENYITKLKNNKPIYDEQRNNLDILELEIQHYSKKMLDKEKELAELQAKKEIADKKLTTLMTKLEQEDNIYKKENNDYESKNKEHLKGIADYEELQKKYKFAICNVEVIKVDLLELEANLLRISNQLKHVQQMFDERDKEMSDDQKQRVINMDYTNFNAGKISYIFLLLISL